MTLKLGGTAINKLHLGATEIKKAYLGSVLVYDKTAIPVANLYDGISVAYGLERLAMTTLWTNAIIKIRRVSDNQEAWVFFDGSSIGDTVTLSSFISTSSNTTPSAVTLSTWLGANTSRLVTWVGMTDDNTVDTGKYITQTTDSDQPQFAVSGVIILENGKPAVKFQSSGKYLEGTANTDLDAGNEFTVFSVSANSTSGLLGTVMSTRDIVTGTSSRFDLSNDRGTVKQISRIRNETPANSVTNTALQKDVGTQKLVSTVKDSSDLIGYYNDVLEETVAWTGSYVNDTLQVGVSRTNQSAIVGTIQAIIIFPSNKTSVIGDIHDDINTRYNTIY